ncbi:MAG TPA: arginine repressor [Allosphingosinicella sp.]|nr:arginine repressor [Allosphingosinicella sp.]
MTDIRTRRLRALTDLIRSGNFASQEEVTAQLDRIGFPVTQATVSRDLEQIGAIKAKRAGTLAYVLPEQMLAGDWGAHRLEKILMEWVVSIEAAGQMIVLKAPPGSAHLVASAIDHAALPEIAGTVSGDDTLFVAVRDGIALHQIMARFQQMMGRQKEMYA